MDFTGNPDVDTRLFLSLSYQDRMAACQANQYLSRLCQNGLLQLKLKQAKERANYMMGFIEKRSISVLAGTNDFRFPDAGNFTIECQNEYEPFESFENVLNYLHIPYVINQEGVPMHFTIYMRHNIYKIEGYDILLDLDMTNSQLRSFLVICYYNALLV